MSATPMHHLGRNEPCHCGSGKKYKHCCLEADEEREREAREEASKQAAAEPEHEARHETHPHPEPKPWKQAAVNTKGFRKFSGPRKVGGG